MSRRRTGRRSTACARTAPPGRSTPPRSAQLGGSSPCARRGTRDTTGSSSPTTLTRATSASTAPSRAECGSPTRTERGSSTPTTSTSASRTTRRAKNVLFIGLGGGSAPKRMWRDFPALQLQVVELDPEVVKAALPLVCAPARPTPRRRRRRRPALAQAPRRALGRDRDRRVLRRLDPVPPRDARVPPARPHRVSRRAGSSS